MLYLKASVQYMLAAMLPIVRHMQPMLPELLQNKGRQVCMKREMPAMMANEWSLQERLASMFG